MRRIAPSSLARAGPSTLCRAGPSCLRIRPSSLPATQQRPFFKLNLFRTPPPPSPVPPQVIQTPLKPLLEQDDLFHPLSESPFTDLRERAQRVKNVSICPVSSEKYGERVRPNFDCPGCGWPTHKDEARWDEGWPEHSEFCARLKEVNEDDHDLRSGRKFPEFENMPRGQPYDEAISFANWDTLFYTRSYPSIDSERSVRHVSKVLTYPMTVAGVMHQNGPYSRGNGRITREGRRSMIALHSQLHVPAGSSESLLPWTPQPPIRIFILGARSESTLPPAHWQQLSWIFPRSYINVYFIGPEAGLPLIGQNDPRRKRGYEFTNEGGWGCPNYTMHVSPFVTLTSLKTNYDPLHYQLGPFDPYADIFFSFHPGLGFPHQPGLDPNRDPSIPVDDPNSHWGEVTTQPLVQAQTTWQYTLRKILQTKCSVFFTAFSPLDLQRDVSALYGTNPPSFRNQSQVREFPDYVGLPTAPVGHIEGVTDEFELLLTPGKNVFGSQRWEVAEWDPRVAVKTNWGVWGIRGKKYEVTEREE